MKLYPLGYGDDTILGLVQSGELCFESLICESHVSTMDSLTLTTYKEVTGDKRETMIRECWL